MNTSVTMTSKGQFTLPVAIRRSMNIKAGDKLNLTYNAKSQSTELKKPMSINEVRAMNQAALKREGTSLKGYKSGDGFAAHVAEKYGV